MENEALKYKLKQLKTEEFIWLIYIFIIFMSWYSNSLERKYFIYNDIESKEKYRKIMVFIFCVLIVVYLYFLKDSYSNLQKINNYDFSKNKILVYLSFIGSFLIVMSGIIFLYIALEDKDLNVELAFN